MITTVAKANCKVFFQLVFGKFSSQSMRQIHADIKNVVKYLLPAPLAATQRDEITAASVSRASKKKK